MLCKNKIILLSSTQEDDTTSNECQALLNEDEAKSAVLAPETQPGENTAPPPAAGEEGTLSFLLF